MGQLDSIRHSRLQEKLLLGFWTGVFLVCLTAFFQTDYQLSFSPEQKEIGKIDQLTDRARVKTHSSLSWFQASTGQTLHHLDQIYTHQGSKLELELFQSGKLVVYENTLLRLIEQQGQTSVDLGQGLITASFNDKSSEAAPFVFTLNGKIYQLNAKNADIQIVNNKKQANIQVLSGTLELRSENERIEIGSNQEIQIDEQSMKTLDLLAVELIAPMQDRLFYTDKKTLVRLEWIADQKSRVRVSSDPLFKNTIGQAQAESGFFELSLGPGLYYWRVEDLEGVQTSQVNRFEIKQEMAPQWISPTRLKTNLRLVRGEGQEKSYPLSWESDGETHQIQVGLRLPDNQMQWFVDEVIEGRVFDLPLDQQGEFIARVKIADPLRESALWSSEISLNIWSKELRTPKRLMPKNDSKFIFFEQNSTQKISWRPVDGIEQYEVRWVSPTGVDSKQIVADSHFHLPLEGDGIYSWQVRSVDGQESSSYSPLQKFDIQMEKFDPSLPENGQLIELDRPDQQVRFEWARAQGVSHYIFEMSASESFEDLSVSEKRSLPRVEVTLPKIGTYYWRTRVVTKEGAEYFSRPFKVTVEPTPPPKKPKIDGQLKIEYLKSTQSFWPNLIDLFFSSAYASAFAIKISWPAAGENIKAYRVRIYQEDQPVLVDVQVDQPFFIWDQAFAGKFYWEVAYIDYWDRVGPFSEPEVFNVSDQNPQKQEVIFSSVQSVDLIRPVHGLEVAADAQILFEWSHNPQDAPVDHYLFEVARDLGFREIVTSKKTDQPRTLWSKSKKDEPPLYWRVTAYQGEAQTKSLRRRLDQRSENLVKDQSLAKKDEPTAKPQANKVSFYYQLGQLDFEQAITRGPVVIDGLSVVGFRLSGEHKKIIYRLDNHGGKVFQDQSFRKTSLSAGHHFSLFQNKLKSSAHLKALRSSAYLINSQTSQVEEQVNNSFAAGVHLGAEFGAWEVEARGYGGGFFELALETRWHLPWLSLSAGFESLSLSEERKLSGASFALGKRFRY